MPTPQQVFDTITNSFPKDFGKDNIVSASIITVEQGAYSTTNGYENTEVITSITGVLTEITEAILKRYATVGIDTVLPSDSSFISKLKIDVSDFIEIKSIRYKVIDVTITPMYECIIRRV